jgi:hypothetical protein
MCRSIKVLRRPGDPVTPEEVSAAALQFVRKISGFRRPSQINEQAFQNAVDEIASASHRLLDSIAQRQSKSASN